MTEKNRLVGNENENLTLACYTLGGIPRSKIIWYHGKKKLTMNKDDSKMAYYSLILKRNHNEQIYTCIAEHDMLRTPLNQSIKLNILYNDSETITHSIPPYSGTSVKVPQREVVRHSPIEIEMQEVSNNEEDVHEESRNLPFLSEILQDLQNTASDDRQSDLSNTNTSQSSSSLSNRSQNINEEDYLHPYHGFVHSRMDVHEYDSVDAKENEECEEITDTSPNQSGDYENLRI
ncbi:unnamed protein product [Mytilus coruscus]|uniref:Ig-like domain-containing protein n=1 Tax=Mytilus coruscus TaxID=42192 RepID=A0A6J8CFC6_MYTCO|nr:unnamed protein product [Mytilus coruscus]